MEYAIVFLPLIRLFYFWIFWKKIGNKFSIINKLSYWLTISAIYHQFIFYNVLINNYYSSTNKLIFKWISSG